MTEFDESRVPWTSQASPTGASPAATLILLRESEHGPGDLLMLRRAPSMAFAANAVAFPGGRVEVADHELAACLDHGLAPEDAAARIAAIRETIEEAGIAAGFRSPPSSKQVAAIRAGLLAGDTLAATISAQHLELDLALLLPFARWCPPNVDNVVRRFDTRFYAARAGAQEGTADNTEHVRLRWASAAAFIADCAAGKEHALFPTLRNLERIAASESIDAVLADARAHRLDLIMPWIEVRADGSHLCIPEGVGYPVTSAPLEDTRRA